MPIFSRRRLHCFYCGKKSTQRYEHGLPKWKCESCQAENWLDKNGEITDPPAPATPVASQTQRYAQPIPRSVSPGPPNTEQSPFCQICLNNQFLITQNLANYLPEPTDPRYSQFEANLPKYRKELEQRYPPVCAKCEPRVRERMRAAGAVAKADYLGKMMDKTRKIGLPKDVWTPIFVLSTLGGLLWFMSTIVLILWNGFGALATHTEMGEGLLGDPEDVNMLRCIGQAIGFARVEDACSTGVYDMAGWAIATNLVSFWWNPIMRRRNVDRTIGLGEFYKLQCILLAARFGAWYLLGNKEQHNFEPSVVRLIHATMLGMNLVVPILAYTTARIAKIPKISFQDRYEPLSDAAQASPETAESVHRDAFPTVRTTTTSTSVSFPFSQVGSSRSSKTPINPQPEEEDEYDFADAMDIDTPQSKHNFRPTSSRFQEITTQEPSPFYGKLPSAPVSQEHRLRNPPNKPSFQKTSSERQDEFFQSMTKSPTNLVQRGSDPPINFHMQAPKLITKQDHEETGLEGWFSSNVFSLGEPKITPDGHQTTTPPQQPISPSSNGLLYQTIPIILLLAAVVAWDSATKVRSASLALYYAAAGIGAVVAGSRLSSVLYQPVINGSDILLCIVELFGAAALGYQTRQAVSSQFDVREALGSFPYLYFGFMIAQECLIILTTYRRSQSQNPRGNLMNQGSSSPRAKKGLPLDSGSSLFQQTSFSNPSPTPSTNKAFPAPNSLATQSPGSAGLAGLSLSLGDGNNLSTSTSTRRTTRALKGRVPKPWEVGGV